MSKDPYDDFLCAVEFDILPHIDFAMLEASYSTPERAYAKQVLATLHQACVKAYGERALSADRSGDFVAVPAVIHAKNTGELCIGLVSLELLSSGEHWGTDFLTEHGVLTQGMADDPVHQERIRRMIPYDYWYTPHIAGDIHVNFFNIPAEAKELLQAKDMTVEPLPHKKETAITNPKKKRSQKGR